MGGAQLIDRENDGEGHGTLGRRLKRWAAVLREEWPKTAAFVDSMVVKWLVSERQWDALGGNEW